jgi:RNA polymerase sigma factor
VGPFLKIFKKTKTPIEDRLTKIKGGDDEERENFIDEYTPFIIKCITKVTNRYIEIENDDEFSIGLEAFNEAINKYEFTKGSFIGYAERVIKSRVIDFHRKTKKLKKVISMDGQDVIENKLEGKSKHCSLTERYEMKEQILELQALLKDFNISFKELVEETPKHIDTRLNAISIANSMTEDDSIKEELYRKKMLPVKKILEKIGGSKKVLKRNRKFIISVALILDSELDVLRDYIYEVEGRKKNGI